MNDQKQHGVYERHHCRFTAAHPTLGLKLHQNPMWTQLSMTLRCVQHNTNFLWGVSKYFSEYCFLSFVKAHPKPIYSSKHSETGKPNFSKPIENDNMFECLWADMNLKSFVTKQATEQTFLVQPQNRRGARFSPHWFQVTLSNNLIRITLSNMHHVHL